VKRFRWLAFVCVIALALAACGRSDTQKGGNDQTSSTTAAGGGSSTGSFGTSPIVCKAGTPKGATAPGVSASDIHIATFSDAGFAGRPGLNQELFDAATVFSKWCNEAGGINGRKIVVDQRDAALTNVKPQMVTSCAEDFMVVGGGAVFDQDGVATRLGCVMPEIPGYVVSSQARGADLSVQPVPNPLGSIPIGDYQYLAKKYPAATQAYGVLTGDIDTTKIVSQQGDEAAKALGWKQVYTNLYPPTGPPDWTPYAQGLKDKGVKGLLWTGEPENLANLLKAVNDIGYTLDFVRTDANHYDKSLISQGGSAIKNVYVRSAFEPFETVKPGSPTQQYLDAFQKYLPNGKAKALLGLQAWSAWMLFATAANECGNDLTRKCVYDNAAKIKAWTGGGLHAAMDLTVKKAGSCFAELVASPSGFKLVNDLKPNEGIFRCDPKAVYTLTGDYGKGTTLADVGKSIADLK
jgi:ABC-type branched-subunit amino acid transport system substrate-binding protein